MRVPLSVLACAAFVLPTCWSFSSPRGVSRYSCRHGSASARAGYLGMSSSEPPLSSVLGKFKSAVSYTIEAARSFNPQVVRAVATKSMQEGTFGSRGEALFVAQALLFVFVLLGDIPLVGPLVSIIGGPGFMFLGLAYGILAVITLGTSLSPLVKPVEGNQLMTQGIYSLCRHPMYSSLILVSIGLGVITDSAERLLISFMLFVLLDKKASKEEEYLLELHPEYNTYRSGVSKFLPFIY